MLCPTNCQLFCYLFTAVTTLEEKESICQTIPFQSSLTVDWTFFWSCSLTVQWLFNFFHFSSAFMWG